MQMNIPWTVYYADQKGQHVVKNVLAPSNITAFSASEIAGILALDGTVQYLTKGHHETASYGVPK